MGYSGYVSVLVGTHMVGLAHHVGGNTQQVGVPLGGRLPVDACATGRALLATMGDGEVRQLLGGRVSLAAPQSPRDFDELLSRLRQIREQGFAESQHEALPGAGAVAVAVADPQTGERLSLCLTYPLLALGPADRKRAIELLLQERRNLMRSHP
jgi:DNA-binding IclR family transcriptional regulator